MQSASNACRAGQRARLALVRGGRRATTPHTRRAAAPRARVYFFLVSLSASTTCNNIRDLASQLMTSHRNNGSSARQALGSSARCGYLARRGCSAKLAAATRAAAAKGGGSARQLRSEARLGGSTRQLRSARLSEARQSLGSSARCGYSARCGCSAKLPANCLRTHTHTHTHTHEQSGAQGSRAERRSGAVG